MFAYFKTIVKFIISLSWRFSLDDCWIRRIKFSIVSSDSSLEFSKSISRKPQVIFFNWR